MSCSCVTSLLTILLGQNAWKIINLCTHFSLLLLFLKTQFCWTFLRILSFHSLSECGNQLEVSPRYLTNSVHSSLDLHIKSMSYHVITYGFPLSPLFAFVQFRAIASSISPPSSCFRRQEKKEQEEKLWKKNLVEKGRKYRRKLLAFKFPAALEVVSEARFGILYSFHLNGKRQMLTIV